MTSDDWPSADYYRLSFPDHVSLACNFCDAVFIFNYVIVHLVRLVTLFHKDCSGEVAWIDCLHFTVANYFMGHHSAQ